MSGIFETTTRQGYGGVRLRRKAVKGKSFVFVMIAGTLLLAGCNTIRGLGQDIQDAGQAIEHTSNK